MTLKVNRASLANSGKQQQEELRLEKALSTNSLKNNNNKKQKEKRTDAGRQDSSCNAFVRLGVELMSKQRC